MKKDITIGEIVALDYRTADDLHTHVHLENNILFLKALMSAN